MKLLSMATLICLASCTINERVNVHIDCTTTAGPTIECAVTQTEGKGEVDVCWDFFTECGNGTVVEAPRTCLKVKDGGTAKVTIPGTKLTNLDKCGGPGSPKAKITNKTLNGKPSEN